MGNESWMTCGQSVRRSFKRFLDKTLENLSSTKFYAMCMATHLAMKGTITDAYWFYTIAFCIATKHFLELAAIVKDVKGMKYGATDAAPPTTQDAKDGTPPTN